MQFIDNLKFYLQTTDRKKLWLFAGMIIVLVGLIATLILGKQIQEIRQRASGEQTELYFADASGARLSTLSLQPSQATTITLYLDTKGNPVNGFDTTIDAGNIAQFAKIGTVGPGSDASKFNILLAEAYDPTTKIIHYARVTNQTGTIIQGVLQLGIATITANAKGAGSLTITKATITSATAEGAGQLTVGLPTLAYAIAPQTSPTTAESPTAATSPTSTQPQTYPGIDLTTVDRYKTGPCLGQAAGSCILDERQINISKTYSTQVEFVIAYGGYFLWRRDNNQIIYSGKLGFLPNGSVDTDTRDACSGHTFPCKIDTSTLTPDSTLSWTAYGKGWNFDANNNPWPGNGFDLTTVNRYKNGPCSGQAANTCTFDTRWVGNLNGQVVESITAYGKGWNFTINGSNATAWPNNGFDLTSVDRYAKGPCQGKAAGQCTFDTRTITPDGNEEITAYGKLWVFDRSGNYIPNS